MNRVAVATIGDVLTHDLNMAQTGKGEGEPVDVAAISGVSRPVDVMAGWAGLEDNDHLVVSWRGGEVLLTAPNWHGATWSQRISLLQAALGVFDCIPKTENAALRWIFSGKTVRQADAADLLERWVQNRAPPVIDLIEFVLENRPSAHILRTVGLWPIVGYEIQADIGGLPDQELARMVGRMAQMVLEFGPPATDIVLGPDGNKYHLTFIEPSDTVCLTMQISAKSGRI